MFKKVSSIISWNIFVALAFIMLLLSTISFYEYYTVKIIHKVEDYPWGWEGCWYYKNPQIYSTIMLIEGVIFLLLASTLTFSVIKANKILSFYITILSFGCIILLAINASIY